MMVVMMNIIIMMMTVVMLVTIMILQVLRLTLLVHGGRSFGHGYILA